MPPADHPGPLVFVESLDDPVLSDADRHHLERVRRIRAGSAITMADGFGRWRTGVLAADLETTGPVEEEPPPHPLLTIGFALVKGDKPELIVQKLTELGIDRVVPFRAERSVVRWDDEKAAKAVARLRTVARSAASQCHRARLPIIDELTDLRALAQEPGVAMADRDGDPPSLDHPVVLIGPEGGWAQEERTLGVPRVALGDHILRAETAGIAAGAILTALRARIVGPRSKDVT